MPLRLSKSRFTAGAQCHKQLWWRVHEPDAPELTAAPGTQARFDQANDIGRLAREYVPGGEQIDFPYYATDEKVQATREAMRRGASVIYEAAFLADNLFAAADILIRDAEGFTLVEVKSSTKVKKEHYMDAAFQAYVLTRAGVEIRRVEVMHLSRNCTFPDLSDLFTRTDVTEKVQELMPSVPTLIDSQLAMLQRDLPLVDIGDHCTRPWRCAFHDRCWSGLPEHHVRTLYKIDKRAEDLLSSGYATIRDIPPGTDFPNRATARQVRAVQADSVIVERDELRLALAKIRFPVAFLDFETVAPAIPRWPGCHPYDKVPVQFSCHRLDVDGRKSHREWLAEGSSDPRPAIAAAVVNACDGAETVIAYNSSFEKECLDSLALVVPELRDKLTGIGARLIDALPLVRDNVYHPAFHGSFSIKKVLPALVPQLTYDGLAIPDGDTASRELARLMFASESVTASDRQKVRRDLLEYCKLDTLAVLRLVDALRALEPTEPQGS